MKTKSYFKINKEGSIAVHNKETSASKNRQLDISAINIGYYIITPLLIGVFLGLMADKKFHSQPKGVLIGIFLGFISTIYNLAQLIKENAGD